VRFDGSNLVFVRKADNFFIKKREKGERDFYFDELYSEHYRCGMKNNVFIRKCYPLFAMHFGFSDENFSFFTRKVRNRYCYYQARKALFKNKALMNRWHYFFTVTYNPAFFSSEEEFVKAFCVFISRYCYREKWRQIGVFERGSKGGRLHYHGLLYLPSSELARIKTSLIERKDYSVRKKKVTVTHFLPEFEFRFGRCDFERLDSVLVERGEILEYIYKYMGKGDNKSFYSRYVPSQFLVDVNLADDTYINSDGEIIMRDYSSTYTCVFCMKYVLRREIFSSTEAGCFTRFDLSAFRHSEPLSEYLAFSS
jgi:hypothetical protein